MPRWAAYEMDYERGTRNKDPRYGYGPYKSKPVVFSLAFFLSSFFSLSFILSWGQSTRHYTKRAWVSFLSYSSRFRFFDFSIPECKITIRYS